MTKPATPIREAGFFVLRTPLLPLDELERWSEGLEAPAAGEPGLAQALASDRTRLRQRLQAFLGRSEAQEALRVASPTLEESLDALLRDAGSERALKVERSVVRYLERMCSRATPFGLFSGCSMGTIGDQTELRLAGQGEYRRHTRLDMEYVSVLAEELGRSPELRAGLTYRPNNSLYVAAGQLRYAEARVQDGQRRYRLVGVEEDAYLRCVLDRARPGARPAELAQTLVETFAGVSREEADTYVTELIDSQILIDDLLPAVTGPLPLGILRDRLAGGAAGSADAARVLGEAEEILTRMDGAGLASQPDAPRELARVLGALPARIDPARLLQVDLTKAVSSARLGPEVVTELRRAVGILHRLGRGAGEPALESFRKAFEERYEAREVPLVEALDAESGIGFGDGARGDEGSPLLAGLELPGLTARETNLPWGPRETTLLPRLEEALRTGRRELELTEADVEKMATKEPLPLPGTFSIMATICASSEQAVAAGDFTVIAQGGGGPGAALMGRFLHADPELHAHVERLVAEEERQHPGAVHAEIAHLPEGRLGNIMARPVLREHEIVYVGASGASPDRQITLDDLMVSVVRGRIVLRSRRLGREVLPRLTCAHNHSAPQNLPAYRFLCALQHQGTTPLGWSWGALEMFSFLPRVRIGRTILSLARWRVDGKDLAELGKGTPDQWYAAVQALRRRLGLPRVIRLVEHDNLLRVDLDNVLSVEAFVATVKGRSSAELQESYPDAGELVAQGPEGRFAHELIVPFVTGTAAEVAEPAPSPAPAAPRLATRVRRAFAPGSEWLYAKLYCGPATADRVLTELVPPVVRSALASGAADGWFFIRYADPEWHVRLRLHGDPRALTERVLPRLQRRAEPFLRRGQVWRLELDTYQREVERYGGDRGIVLAEQLFQHDSESALALLAQLGDDDPDRRWQWTLLGIDRLLGDLGLGLEEKRALMAAQRRAFGHEHGVEGPGEHALGLKFRGVRPKLEALLVGDEGPAHDVFQARSRRLEPVVRQLRQAQQRGQLPLSMAELAASYVHMLANRMFRSAARAQELVVYDFLNRLYESQLARARKSPRPLANAA